MQSGTLVSGLEGDFDYFHSKANFSNNTNTLSDGNTFTISQSLTTDFLATVRPRIGIAADRNLAYITGGAAFTRVSYTESYVDGAAPPGAGTATASRYLAVGLPAPAGNMPLRPIGRCEPNIFMPPFQKPVRSVQSPTPVGHKHAARFLGSRDPAGPRQRQFQILIARKRHARFGFRLILHCPFAHAPESGRGETRKQNGNAMSIDLETKQAPSRSRQQAERRHCPVLLTIVASLVPPVGFTTTAARACACGCSVFDVGGLDLPQEQDHGGRVFFEFWGTDQTQNYVGSSKAPAAINLDKQLNTQWYNAGFSYNFNRDWGVMLRIPTANRTLTTDTGAYAGITSFNSKDVADIEIMGIYTGFFKDMSTGIIFGVKLPTGTFQAPGMDRDNQIGTGSTDLLLGAFHRGLLSGDNAWQYFSQIMWRQPFLYQAAVDPQGSLTEIPDVLQTYFPGCRSMRRPASFITTCTMCSASTRSRRSGR